ncbi:MAG: hypothetical protein KatS3mg102_2033 [Planctomycetota bacterium]|nr:MAG: hypothetical protein KatS3mg102_2033 [Planctomycetota bacterium]
MSFLRRCGWAVASAALVVALAAGPAWAGLSSSEWNQAKREFERAFAGNDAEGMVAAVQKIAQDDSPRAVDLLVNVGAQLDNIKVYEAVRAALGGMKDPETVAYMVKQLERQSSPAKWQSRCVLCEALVPHQGEEVTRAIAARLDDKVPYVISAAAKALGKRRDPKGVEPLIAKLRELEKNKGRHLDRRSSRR